MNVVSHAGPLINLAKLGILDVPLRYIQLSLYHLRCMTTGVLRGKEQHHPNAYVVELAIARDDLILLPLPDLELFDAIRVLPIDQGEK